MDWQKQPPKLRKEFKFKDFLSALSFVNEVANVVIIETWTHSENDITEKDYELAKKIDEII